MKTLMIGIAVGSLVWGAAVARADSGAGVGQVPAERAMARYPADWVAQPPVRQEQLTVIRLLPPGQTAQDFSQAITVERYESEHRSPKDFVLSRAEASRGTCDGMLAGEVVEGVINGYKAASLRFTCTRSQRNNKSGAVSLTAIAGRDALHVISWFWLGAPVAANQLVPVPPQTVAQWDAFTKTILVCDTRDSTHPCPTQSHK
jgi:hypothetical protein